MRTTPATIGLALGILAGLVWVFGGFGGLVLVAFCGAVGFFVAKVLQGDIDLTELADRIPTGSSSSSSSSSSTSSSTRRR